MLSEKFQPSGQSLFIARRKQQNVPLGMCCSKCTIESEDGAAANVLLTRCCRLGWSQTEVKRSDKDRKVFARGSKTTWTKDCAAPTYVGEHLSGAARCFSAWAYKDRCHSLLFRRPKFGRYRGAVVWTSRTIFRPGAAKHTQGQEKQRATAQWIIAPELYWIEQATFWRWPAGSQSRK